VFCNGTKASGPGVSKNAIDVEIVLAGQHVGKRVFLPQIPLYSFDDEISLSGLKETISYQAHQLFHDNKQGTRINNSTRGRVLVRA
jgi:hypothetical protein